jgi:hypothetical protein
MVQGWSGVDNKRVMCTITLTHRRQPMCEGVMVLVARFLPIPDQTLHVVTITLRLRVGDFYG